MLVYRQERQWLTTAQECVVCHLPLPLPLEIAGVGGNYNLGLLSAHPTITKLC